MAYTPVSAAEFARLDDLDDWRLVVSSIHGRFRAPSFPEAGALVGRIANAAEAADHHPDVELRYPGIVHVVLSTHAIGGVSDADVALARTISALASHAGATADAAAPQTVEIAIDTMNADAIRPFWAAVLAYRETADGSLADPTGAGPSIWFQQMDEPRRERSRFHIDVVVPHDRADQRVAEALAAGGRLMTDEFARSWWVLADADGNEACVCTWEDRTPATS